MRLWYAPHPGLVRYLFGRIGTPRIDDVLDHWQPIAPVVLSVVTKYSKHYFHVLVCSFALAIGLWVVHGTYVLFDFQQITDLYEHLTCKTRVPITDQPRQDSNIWKGLCEIQTSQVS